MKRKIASVVAMSLLGLQALSGIATAIPGNGNGHQNGGSAGCVYAAGLLQVSTSGTVDLTFTTVSGVLKVACNASVGDDIAAQTFATVAAIQIVADGNVTIDLQDSVSPYYPVSFSGKSLEIDTSGALEFDGDDNAMTRAYSVSVSDSAMSVNGSTGALAFAASVVFKGNNGADTFDASKLSGIPVTADGRGGADTLKGGDDADTLVGGLTVAGSPAADAKVDTLVGGEGDDDFTSDTFSYLGSTVGDAVFPGDGYNDINGNAGLVSYLGASSGVEIDLSETQPAVVHDDGAIDEFDSSPTIRKWAGSDEADFFLGSGSANSFSGNGGADVIVGAGGNDVLMGGDGADRIRGAKGADTIWGDAGNDTLSGGADDDVIRGFGGDDVLYGRGGADSLMGDAGSDEAWGGNGGDICGAEVTDHCEFAR